MRLISILKSPNICYLVRQKLENKITTKELGSYSKASGFCLGGFRFKYTSRYRQYYWRLLSLMCPSFFIQLSKNLKLGHESFLPYLI